MHATAQPFFGTLKFLDAVNETESLGYYLAGIILRDF